MNTGLFILGGTNHYKTSDVICMLTMLVLFVEWRKSPKPLYSIVFLNLEMCFLAFRFHLEKRRYDRRHYTSHVFYKKVVY